MLRYLCCALLLFGPVECGKLQDAFVMGDWQRDGRSKPTTTLRLTLALRPKNLDVLDQEVLAVSSPNSPRYGQHLSAGEIAELTAPSNASQQDVLQWLHAAGCKYELSKWGDRIDVFANVSQVERMFETEIFNYKVNDHQFIQADTLHVPDRLLAAIDSVFGLHGSPLEQPLPRPRADQDGDLKVTPSVLREMYHIEGVNVDRQSKNKRATAQFQFQFTSQPDLTAFFKEFVPDAQQGDDQFTCFPSGSCTGKPGIEAQMDAQYIMGVSPGIKTEVWTYNDPQWCTALKRWTSAIIDADEPPQVFSVSYGVQYNTSDYERIWGCTEVLATNIEADFAKIAARGISLIFASGDSGSGGGRPGIKLWPAWPGSAPHVTAVGATGFAGQDPSQGEHASTDFASGGGFDWRWSVPDWQKDAVSAFLDASAAHLPHEADFNRHGRATPDVSALGEGFQVMNSGTLHNTGGTSASTPVLASIVSLLNEYRIQQGMSSLGWLNPLFYEMAQQGKGWTDITVGDNRPVDTSQGYFCTKGWDAVTGLGTPTFPEMLEYIKNLPSGSRPDVIV